MAFESLIAYKYTVLFYGLLFLFIYLNRKKFETQAKIIFLYRTKIGIKLMDWMAKKAGATIRAISRVGIVVGFLGMLFIIFVLFDGLYKMLQAFLTGEEVVAVIAPVLPGVPIPGSPIQIPLVIGWLALFIVVVIHEFSHGVVSKAHNIPIKSSGIVFFGPLGGAFVEPDENKLRRQKPIVQNSIFAAGPFSNILTAIIFLLLLYVLVVPAINGFLDNENIMFSEVFEDNPAYQAGIRPNTVYTHINSKKISNYSVFLEELKVTQPGGTVTLNNHQGEYVITTTPHPENNSISYIGITPEFGSTFSLLLIVRSLFIWIFLLSLGLGLANLIPLGPVDGGRMFQTTLGLFMRKKKANMIWIKVTTLFLILLLILLFPIIKAIFLALFGFLL